MLATLLPYLSFLGTSVGLLIVGLGVYVMITPYPEITLIREGNKAAALSFGGTAIGMACVLFSVASGTFNPLELAVWGGIGLATQLLVFFIVTLIVPALKQGIVEDRVACGIVLATLSIAMGILSAGAMSE